MAAQAPPHRSFFDSRSSRFSTNSTNSNSSNTTTTNYAPIAEETVIFNDTNDDPETNLQQHFQQTLADTVRPYYEQHTPVVLRGAARHVPALRTWPDLHHYLAPKIGPHRLFDIEVGGGYRRRDAVEFVEIPFDQYLVYLDLWQEQQLKHNDDSSNNSNGSTLPPEHVLYLAQNDLPPELEDDIVIPALCYDPTLGVGHGRLYQRNLWVGPGQTVSPLHYDPLDNLFLQILGRKRVFLLRPFPTPAEDSSSNSQQQQQQLLLYTGKPNGQQDNTSAVNVEHPDYGQHPRFREVADQVLSAELQPGDILYIPKKWWHGVRSLDLSISVNVWWR